MAYNMIMPPLGRYTASAHGLRLHLNLTAFLQLKAPSEGTTQRQATICPLRLKHQHEQPREQRQPRRPTTFLAEARAGGKTEGSLAYSLAGCYLVIMPRTTYLELCNIVELNARCKRN